MNMMLGRWILTGTRLLDFEVQNHPAHIKPRNIKNLING